MTVLNSATKVRTGSSVLLGEGYTAYVEDTSDGKRWVIRDANHKRIPGGPAHYKYLSDAKNHYSITSLSRLEGG